jgi:hypothetical protein
MGRIADAALDILADGPAPYAALADALARSGVTRARDPLAAVRRALRDDPRVLEIPDGRVTRLDRALEGVVLTARVSPEDAERGALDTQSDLSPLGVLGVDLVPLPAGTAAGDHVAVTVDRVPGTGLRVEPASPPDGRPPDEALLARAVDAQLRTDGPRGWATPPVTSLGWVFLGVAAANPGAFRAPGRPLSSALRDAGWEVHLGWVGPPGTRWTSLTEIEVESLESDVADLLAAERHAEAADVQDRLVSVLRRHLPDRVPAARRRLARVLARAGRAGDALSVLTGAFAFGDPEDRYEACVLAVRGGDVTNARRWAEEGLARTDGAEHAEVAGCLEDIASDLDALAAYAWVREWLPRADEPEAAERLVQALLAPHRAYLVEMLVEEAFADADPAAARATLEAMGRLGDAGRDACLACAAVLPASLAATAQRAAGGRVRARRAWVRGLVGSALAGAWLTSPLDAPDQQQLIIAVAREAGRVAPLVVLVDHADLAGAAKDAFFLPDIAGARLEREVLQPMAELGLPADPLPVEDAVGLLRAALDRAAAIGWRFPSLEQQPVLDRIGRWVLGDASAEPGPRHGVADG